MFCVQSFNCLAFMLSRPLKEPPQIIEPEVKPSTPSKEKRKSASKTKEPQREVRHECDLRLNGVRSREVIRESLRSMFNKRKEIPLP